MYFDYPNMQVIEKTTSRIFRNTDQYVIDYSTDDGEAKLSEIPAKLLEKLSSSVYTLIYYGTVKDMKIEKQTMMNINGIDVLEISGSVVCIDDDSGETTSLPMKGYTYCLQGGIFELVGVMTDKNAGTDTYNQMTKLVTDMINTLRTHK